MKSGVMKVQLALGLARARPKPLYDTFYPKTGEWLAAHAQWRHCVGEVAEALEIAGGLAPLDKEQFRQACETWVVEIRDGKPSQVGGR